MPSFEYRVRIAWEDRDEATVDLSTYIDGKRVDSDQRVIANLIQAHQCAAIIFYQLADTLAVTKEIS